MAVVDPVPETSILARVTEAQRARLAARGREVTVAPGTWLIRRGELADAMFVIRSGRLEAIEEGPPQTVIRTLRRGDVVGELALLHAGRRTASVRARRETVLLEVSRSQFEALIEEDPGFALALARAVGAQLAVSHGPVTATPARRTVAVIRLDGAAPGPALVEVFVDALTEGGGVATLRPQANTSDAELLPAIDQAERDAEQVLLLCGDTGDGGETETWTALCLREADTVLALTSGRPDRRWLTCPELQGCELLVNGRHAPAELVRALKPRELQVVLKPSDLSSRLRATARRLSGRATGVVLSGGGVRAVAHLGVVQELLAAGVKIDRIGGVSSGAATAAGIAAGWDVEDLLRTLRKSMVEGKPAADYAVPAYALLRGRRAREVITSLVGNLRIEELAMRYFSVSCDLVTRERVVHRRGPLVDAVYPSLAIPGLLPPVATSDGRLLVDGGVLDNLPVATMARAGEGPVIASDVTSQPDAFRSRPRSRGMVRSSLRRRLTGSAASLPRLSETIVRTVTVGSADTVTAGRKHADLVITPAIAGVGLMEWKRFDEMRELGVLAARRALEENGDLLWS